MSVSQSLDDSLFFFFKQKTAYELRISDWSSDVCSSDLYPVASATGEYAIGSPLFQKAELTMPNGKTLTINAKNNSDANIYLQSVAIGGKQNGRATCRERVGQYV